MLIVSPKALLLQAVSPLDWAYPVTRGSCLGTIGLMSTRFGYTSSYTTIIWPCSWPTSVLDSRQRSLRLLLFFLALCEIAIFQYASLVLVSDDVPWASGI